MTDVGELVVRIKADAAQLKTELASATSTVKQSSTEMGNALGEVKKMMGELGIALSIGAFVEFTKGAIEAADNLYIMSQRTGIAASTLSALNIPLKQNGSSVDEFSSSMKFLSRNIELASEGNQMLIKRFDDLGLSVMKLKSLTPEQQFYAVAAALAQVTDQSQFAADGLTLMGRGAAGLFPLIKDTNGQLADFVQKQKEMGNALTDDEIKKVHEYEDAWISLIEHAKIGIVELTLSIRDLAKSSPLGTIGNVIDIVHLQNSMGRQQAQNDYMKKLQSGGFTGVQFTKPQPDASAKGDNSDIAGTGKYQVNEVEAYIQSLKDEADALTKSKLALEQYKAEKEAASKAITDFNNGLRDSKDLSDQEKSLIDARVAALDQQKQAQEELNKAQQKQIAMMAQLDAQVSSSLADMVVNYKNAGNAIEGVINNIAKKLIEENITSPLTNSLSGFGQSFLGSYFGVGQQMSQGDFMSTMSDLGSPGGLGIEGFASGGNPPVGVPSMVGENGPELFVPNQSGTIIPNHKLNGTNVTVQQTINLSPGLAETVNAAIMNAAPAIASMAHSGVMQAIQKGGAESRIVGRRNN